MLTNGQSFKLLLSFAFVSAIPLSTGCLASTVVGTTNDGGGTAATGTSSGGSGPTSNSIALRYDQFPELGSGGGTSSVGSGGGPAADTLFIEIDSGLVACNDPFGSGNGSHWHVSIGLPTSYQAVGTYSLSNFDLISTFSEIDSSTGSGGSFIDGTITITSIDASSVHVTLSGTSTDLPSDGDYVVPRCGAAPQPDAIALRYDQFPPPDPSGTSNVSSGTSGGVDPSTLYVIVGDQLAVCADPFAVDCSAAHWQVSVGLPPAYQTPGQYLLNDPAIISNAFDWEPSTPGDCSGGGGSFLDGTITVESIDAGSLVVRFDDVANHAAELGQSLSVSRCP